MIRIANGQGFWGDWLEAPVRLVEDGPIDYLGLDYLAEITMSIVQKQKLANPDLGYARDFPPLMARIGKTVRERGIKVIANAGGVNPRACAREVLRVAPWLKVAVVEGDDLYPQLDELLAKGLELKNMETGEGLGTIRDRIQSANAYIGAFPLAEALATGADVVIAGRCTDTALALAPMIHAYGWRPTDWDLLAAGTVAGHIIECGAQATGGNSQVDWQTIEDFANIGYPIVEVENDGTFTVTKHKGTGGRVHSDVVKEQLLYELGDPAEYITPDCVADFTTIRLRDTGPNRVQVSGVKGRENTPFLKVSISYAAGWKATGTLVYSWPDALAKAYAAERVLRERLSKLGLEFEDVHAEFLGANACHGPVAAWGTRLDHPEIQLRVGVRGQDPAAVERFTRELIPLVLSGPPTATGFGEGKPPVREVVAYWPALVPREVIQTRVEVMS
jgi:hypothetical protein